jgi:aminopeptidase N
MNRFRRIFSFVPAAVITIAAFSTYAQVPRRNFNRAQTFDAQNYTIRVSFDRAKKKVFGDTTVSLKPLTAAFRTVELDAVGLVFDSVGLEPSGASLKYQTLPRKVIVTLDKSYGPDDEISIRFKYSAVPKKGIYFIPADQTHSDQIWSQGEAEEGRYWFPSFDFPSDKAASEEYVTAQKDETVVGNGELLDKIENANETATWHYKMSIPHSTYLISLVVGRYAKVTDQYKQTPLGFYVYPGRETTAVNAFGGTKDMIAAFEELTGVPFPYNKYDQTVVAGFKFGGMENITATTMADTAIYLADIELTKSYVTDLVSHELAHSWFGDLVTCRNWAELWLNEGFATYMEAAYREKAFGHDDYLKKIREDAADFLIDDAKTTKRHGLFNLRAGNVDALFDNSAVTYSKGSAVLHTLREQVGAEAFWRALNIYLNRHKFANVESSDLEKVIEETSGQDLKWFFNQWVYHAGAPRLDIRRTYNNRTKTLVLTIAQTQKIDPLIPAAFRLPLEITIRTASGDTTHTLDITKRLQTFSFKTPQPTELVIDQYLKIPLKRVKLGSMTVVR